LFPTLSVLENLLIALWQGKLGALLTLLTMRGDIRHGGEPVQLVEGLLAFVGYDGALERPAGELAHVDKRVVEIARALATQPRVLLLDEPAAGLGPHGLERLGKLLRQVADAGVAVVLVEHHMHMPFVMGLSDHAVLAELRAAGITVLLVDQRVDLALAVADRGYILQTGRLVQEGAAAEIYNDTALERAYLGEFT
jgi:branched-chain amino acid transport system ATP-binding protein